MFQTNDDLLLRDLYQNHKPDLWKFAKNYKVCIRDAESFYTAAFNQAFLSKKTQGLAELASRNELESYLTKCMRNIIVRESAIQKQTDELRDAIQEITPTTSALDESIEKKVSFYRALRAMPLKTRQVVYAGVKYQTDVDIAQEIGLTPRQVKIRRCVAQDILRKHGVHAGITPFPAFLLYAIRSPSPRERFLSSKLFIQALFKKTQTMAEQTATHLTNITSEHPATIVTTTTAGGAAVKILAVSLTAATGVTTGVTLYTHTKPGNPPAATARATTFTSKNLLTGQRAASSTMHAASRPSNLSTSRHTQPHHHKKKKKKHQHKRRHTQQQQAPINRQAPPVPTTPAQPAPTPPPAAPPKPKPQAPSGPGAGDLGDWQ